MTPPTADVVPASSRFGRDVVRGLSRQPKQLDARYFYDAVGSALFDAICQLPWYPVTRAERRLLETRGDELAERLSGVERLVELGPGNGVKLRKVVDALKRRGPLPSVHLVDVSASALVAARRNVRTAGVGRVTSDRSTYERGLDRLAGAHRSDATTAILFLGSNIGNFHPPRARRLLARAAAALQPGGFLILGADLVKTEAELLAAYDDPLGVTAAFNKNILVRINRELQGDADLGAFDHQARWNAHRSRVEMHLVSRQAQMLTIGAAHFSVPFAAGESIWTESSYKFTPAGIADLGRCAGFEVTWQAIDDCGRFALTLFRKRN